MPIDPPSFPATTQQVVDHVGSYADKAARKTSGIGPRKVTRTPLSLFTSGHGWAKQSGAGAQSDDTTDFVAGDRSLRMLTTGAGDAHSTRKTGLGPFDLRNKSLLIWVKVDDYAKVKDLIVYASSDVLTNYYSWRIQGSTVPTGTPYIENNVWVPVTLSFADATVVGTPNRAAIVTLQLRTADQSSGALDVRWGGVSSIPNPPRGTVTLTFDDGWDSQLEARRMMESKGFAGTAYIIRDLVGTAGYMTLAQLKELQKSNGWDIASHANTIANHNARYTTLTDAQVHADFANLKTWLVENGFDGSDHFAWPGGAHDQQRRDIAAQYFSTLRTIWGAGTAGVAYTETSPPADVNRIRCWSVTNTDTLASITAMVDKAAAEGSWLVLCFHKIVAAPSAAIEFSTANFQSLMDYLAGAEVDVRTMSEQIIRGGETKPDPAVKVTTRATDFFCISPQPTKYLEDTFVAKTDTVEFVYNVSPTLYDSYVGNTPLTLYYADQSVVPAGPLVTYAQDAGERAGVQTKFVGVIRNSGTHQASALLTGLIPGRTYRWQLAASVVGYATEITLPDTPMFIATSRAPFVPTDNKRPWNSRLIAVVSATKLHIIREQHDGIVEDVLLTGAGFALTAGRNSGQVAISPSGKRILVVNNALNTASIIDVSDPAVPVKVGSDIAIAASSYAACFQNDDTAWVANLFAAPTTVQKITGVSGGAPAAQTPVTVDALAGFVQKISCTPDGTKLVVSTNTAANKVFVVNTATNAVSSVTLGGVNGWSQAASNTRAVAMYGNSPSTVAVINLTSMTIEAQNAPTNEGGALDQTQIVSMGAFEDDGAVMFFRNAAYNVGPIEHIMLPYANGDTDVHRYLHWGFESARTMVHGTVDDNGNIYALTSSPNRISLWYGVKFSIAPIGSPYFFERGEVRVYT